MKLHLRTRNVFIDTQAFIAANFDYSSRAFKQLTALAEARSVKLFLTSITVREVEGHITSEVEAAYTAAKHFRKDARILQHVDSPPFGLILRRFDKAEIIKDLIGRLHEFIKKANVTVLPIVDASVKTVLNSYFDVAPPFSQGNKKSEFPDAFAIEALRTWCSAKKETMYVVSGDADWKSACETADLLVHLESPEQFLDLVSRQDKELSEHALKLLDENLSQAEDKVAKAFESAGFVVKTGEGEVDSISLSSIEIDEVFLLEAKEESATFEVEVIAQYTAEIFYRIRDRSHMERNIRQTTPRTSTDTAPKERRFSRPRFYWNMTTKVAP